MQLLRRSICALNKEVLKRDIILNLNLKRVLKLKILLNHFDETQQLFIERLAVIVGYENIGINKTTNLQLQDIKNKNVKMTDELKQIIDEYIK